MPSVSALMFESEGSGTSDVGEEPEGLGILQTRSNEEIGGAASSFVHEWPGCQSSRETLEGDNSRHGSPNPQSVIIVT
jgi:hypothetical protein